MNDVVVGYGNEILEAKSGRRSVYAKLFTLSFTLFITAGLVWSNYAVLEEVTRGTGRVVPTNRLQIIQILDPGIIKNIFVKEGELVTKGQLLVQIDDINFASKLGEFKQKELALSIRLARLQSEAEGKKKLVISRRLKKIAPKSVKAARRLMYSRHRKYVEDLAVLRHAKAQRVQEVKELKAKISRLKISVSLISKELKINKKYRRSGVVSKVSYLKLRRDTNDLKRDLNASRLAYPRALAAIKEAEARSASFREAQQAEIRTELAEVSSELSIVKEALFGAKDRVGRTSIKSPVDGHINTIHISTIGGVVQSSKPIMDIVPTGDNLLIEANIRPKDIGFLHPGQSAIVKISAYDYTIYGSLDAQLEAISADSFVNDEGDTFYKIKVRTKDTALEYGGKKLKVIPGMVATAEVITGEKSILQYLIKPFIKARHEAMRER